MKLFRLMWPASVALLVMLCVFALTASAHPSRLGKPTLSNTPAVTIPCGVSQVPYSVFSMPITQTETLSLTFQASGAGLITFVANNFQQSYWARTDASCGSCTLTIPNVQPGTLGILQLSATAAADACPSSGMTVSNFVLTVTPNTPSVK